MKDKNKKHQDLDRDRHVLYQLAVQDVVAEIDFVEAIFEELRGRRATRLREDFCGTANTGCEWVRRNPRHQALAIDQDPKVLRWAKAHNLAGLSADQRARIELLCADVREVGKPRMDVVLAMNFSYYLFLSREQMGRYFRAARRSLAADGIFFLDAYGGYDAPREIEETRDCGTFKYIWEQASFNPVDSQMQCYIHFEFPDGSRMHRAFSYYWRLWTVPEIRELLTEAGFSRSRVYWEGTDAESNEGNGIFTPTERGDADPGWICYIIAEP